MGALGSAVARLSNINILELMVPVGLSYRLVCSAVSPIVRFRNMILELARAARESAAVPINEGDDSMPRLKSVLAEGKLARMFGIGQLFSTKLIELVGLHGGFEVLWLDAEHAGFSMKDVELAVLAAKAHGIDPIVRMPATDYATVMRTLEAGAGGLIISMVEDAAAAEQAVQWAKFWPRGRRGLNGGNIDGRFGLEPLTEYTKRVNEETFLGIQIETAGALDQVERIAAIDGVDLVFVGPADLSQTLGLIGDFENPKCLEAIQRIAQACRKAGKPWGIVPRGADYASRMREWGCRLFVLGFDIHAFHAGVKAAKERYAGFFETGA